MRRDTARGTHTITNQRDDGDVIDKLNRLKQAIFEFQFKCIRQRLLCQSFMLCFDTETDAVFRRRLSNEHDRHICR
ncbi:Uncharacterised protein [Vibrio cholerae]|uniref:Uncharacterized protein n=1 Tax=Vibrio cholerae TaxID=666 RepID=A0A655TUH4_VIBCL|nr:Uncharacterised protein [Vibrio cholerae]CSC47525.1 Uncharacterised protein [Vibrio cholerae]CSC79062.1 Uncharacterised protein [Vibrio cholerae]CSI47153.1 Uncharacterised protein [Vibrio cholerae]CSI61132.1 Uncharacterised protein [Vibrio cholerae]